MLHDQSLECCTGERRTCLILQLIKSTRESFPCGLCGVGLISTRLCSVDRKNKRGETGSEEKEEEEEGGREGWGGASAGTQKQAGEA